MKIAVFGANGRVGSKVCEIAKSRGHQVIAIDKDTEVPKNCDVDVVIDFSTPEATESVCDFCCKHHCPLVSGVTGRNKEQKEILEETGRSVTVKESANFSVGMQQMYALCQTLAKLGWDTEIVETHRKGKLDSPSGTAKQLACEITQNGTRKVTIHSLRAGSNFGTHEVIFATEGESLTLTHRAENVQIFALGAIKCAEELIDGQNNTITSRNDKEI